LDIEGSVPWTQSWSSRKVPGDRVALGAKVQEALVKSFGSVKIQTLHLHGPERSTSIEETHRAVDDLYKEGISQALHKEFEPSNFTSLEAAEAACTAGRHGWTKSTTISQGLCNAIERNVQ
ncbi:hypothetical protein HD554DRAFT_1991542, partial [Boletus coccyginus]